MRELLDDASVVRVVLVAHCGYYMRTQAIPLEEGLRRSILALTAAGKEVVLVEPFPTYGHPVPAALVALPTAAPFAHMPTAFDH